MFNAALKIMAYDMVLPYCAYIFCGSGIWTGLSRDGLSLFTMSEASAGEPIRDIRDSV